MVMARWSGRVRHGAGIAAFGRTRRPFATAHTAGMGLRALGALLMAGALVCAVTAHADAGAPLRWRDGAARSTGTPVPVHAAPQLSRRTAGGVDVVLEPTAEGGWEVWVENPLFGPVEALIEVQGGVALQTSPALPARVRVPAQRRVLATRLTSRSDSVRAPALRLLAVAGDPSAHPQDHDYRFPLGTDRAQVSQGWGGHFSHRTPEHRHALDLAAAEGTPVLAARAGVVMQVASGAAGPPDAGDAAGGNAIRILHEDGSMALYAHLSDAGLDVRPGQRVRRGDPIARVGNTGYSTGAHLHFAVQVNRGLRLETVPFRMSGPDGVLRLQETP